MELGFRSGRWGRRWWTAVALIFGALAFPACETVEPGPRLRFVPGNLSARIGEARPFRGTVTMGNPSGTWFVQPNSIQIAQIEITGELEANLICLEPGAGAFVLSVLTTQGMASGNFYFTCGF